jgi:ABC-type sulfate transport system permease subunit
MPRAIAARYGIRTLALGYLAAILVLPCSMIVYHTFEAG